MRKALSNPLVYRRASWVDDETWNVANTVATENKLSTEDRQTFFMRMGLIEMRVFSLSTRSWRPRREGLSTNRKTAQDLLFG